MRRSFFLFIAPTVASQVAPPISAGVFQKKSGKRRQNQRFPQSRRNLQTLLRFSIIRVPLFSFRCAVRSLAVGAFVLALIYIRPATDRKRQKKSQFFQKSQYFRPVALFRRRFDANAPPPRPVEPRRAAVCSPPPPPDLPDAKKALK